MQSWVNPAGCDGCTRTSAVYGTECKTDSGQSTAGRRVARNLHNLYSACEMDGEFGADAGYLYLSCGSLSGGEGSVEGRSGAVILSL